MTMRKMMMAACVLFASALLAVSVQAESKARIVRLSDVQGSVQMDRGTGDGFDKAFLNMPVVEASRLKTGDDGRAEVEFEDGSTLRVLPGSELEFTRLALGDDGAKLSAIQIAAGLVYVNFRGRKSDPITLSFGRESLTVTEPAHFRVGLDRERATVAAIKGRVAVSGASGEVAVEQKHSATFDLADDRYEVAKNYEELASDAWDREQGEYHDRYASRGNSYSGSPYAYGMSDLNYYGNFMMVPGYGWGWQPYFLDASWSPYQDGGWMYYPGSGYMWVSSYPWGWMPYRYGNWAFVPGYGWIWQPGYWNTWYALPRVINPPARTAVPVPPTRSHGTVMVGRGLSINPPAGFPRKVLIAPGSAGLGVPRGTVKDLDRASREVSRINRPVTVATEPNGRIAPPRRATTTSPGSHTAWPSASPSSTMPSAPPARTSRPVRSTKPH